MAASMNFANEARKGLSALKLERIEIDSKLAHIEAQGGTIDLELFRADKLEKVVFCTIRIDDLGVVESTAMAWPDDNHNLPMLWCNLTVVESVMNVPIFDFAPMMDIVVWPDYAETYIAGTAEIRRKALKIMGKTITDKAVDLPSLAVYVLSPYKLVARVTDEGISKTAEILRLYTSEYCKLWENATGVVNARDKAYYLKKKSAIRKLMKANDPGYAFTVSVFGEELTKDIFDIVF